MSSAKEYEVPAVRERQLKKWLQNGWSTIVLYNDDVNTFDFVIESLIELCDHSPEQAEQCTIIVHYKGKCEVKEGVREQLQPICKALISRGLTAELEG